METGDLKRQNRSLLVKPLAAKGVLVANQAHSRTALGSFTRWFALLACLLGFVSPHSALGSTIVVDASFKKGELRNISGGINFWANPVAQKRFVEEIGTDLYRLKIRLHGIKKIGGSYGNLPWQGDDVTRRQMDLIVNDINTARSKGCRIMVQIYGIPKWLSTGKSEKIITNNLPDYAKYPPKDYNEWARLVSWVVKALKRIGLVAVDYYEIFGEPNAGSTWYAQTMPCNKDGSIVYGCRPNELNHNTVVVMKNFFRLYRFTAQAIKAADPKAKIGCAAIIPNPNGIWWTRFLVEYARANRVPLDFYSWHWYGIDEALAAVLRHIGDNDFNIDFVRRYFEGKLRAQGFRAFEINSVIGDLFDYLDDLTKKRWRAVRHPYSFVSSYFRKMLSEEGFDKAELLLTEWNVNHEPDRRHDTHYAASFIVRGLIDMTDARCDGQCYYVLSSQKPIYDDRGFAGFYGLFREDGTNLPKASFNAFKMFSMLGDHTQRIAVQASDHDLYGIATATDDSIAVLATYYVADRHPDYNQHKSVTLTIRNMAFPKFSYEVFAIDKNHANSYYGANAELEVIDKGKGSNLFTKHITLPIYGVVMVRLKRLRRGI